MTALHLAAYSNKNPLILTALLDSGFNPNARNEDNQTPLHLAAEWSDSPAVLTTLLDAGADPKAQDKDANTPWDLAKDREALKGSEAYWQLNDGRF